MSDLGDTADLVLKRRPRGRSHPDIPKTHSVAGKNVRQPYRVLLAGSAQALEDALNGAFEQGYVLDHFYHTVYGRMPHQIYTAIVRLEQIGGSR